MVNHNVSVRDVQQTGMPASQTYRLFSLKDRKSPAALLLPDFPPLAHKDSNLEMTESESVALPFGDGPLPFNNGDYNPSSRKWQVENYHIL